MGDQRHAPAGLPLGKTRYHCIGDWVGPGAGLDGCGKSRPPTGIRSPDRPALASRYTDYAIPVHLSSRPFFVYVYS